MKRQLTLKKNYRNFTRKNFNKLPNSRDNIWCIRIVNRTEDTWEVYGPRVEKIMETRKYGAMATDVSKSTAFLKSDIIKGFSSNIFKVTFGGNVKGSVC